VPSIDKCPPRADPAAVTLPSPPGLRCLFALAVSLRARPPFTPPGPMAGKRFSGPDTAYLCLQHNTTPEHIHEGVVLARGKARAFLSLSFSSRHHRPKRIPIAAPGNPLVSEKPASGINLARISRPSCCIELDPGQDAKEQGTGPGAAYPPRCTSDTLCRKHRMPQGWNSLAQIRVRQEPWFSHPREGESRPGGSGCLPPTEVFQRIALNLAFFPRRNP